jgi:N-methylhydantoinase B
MVGIYNGILDHHVPANAGSFRRVTVKVRENCAVGIPHHPFSCSFATTNLADRVSNPAQRALAEIAPGFGQAETGPIQPPGMGVISGKDPRHEGARFVNQVHVGIGGGAATPVTDAFLSIIHVGNAGMCRIDCVEVDELGHPMHVVRRGIVPDTRARAHSEGPLNLR